MVQEIEALMLEPEDHDRATIARQARLGLPLLLPWHPSLTIKPGTLFHSRLAETKDPWSKNSPFSADSIANTLVIYTKDDGGRASFKSVSSSSSTSTSEHMSVGMGITVGCAFLSMSVSGQYDRDVMFNRDANKSSIRSTYRNGTVLLSKPYALTSEARITLRFNGGLPAFKERYGDYYVAGYRLGADVGLIMSESHSSSSLTETVSLEVKIKILFATISARASTHSIARSESQNLRVVGYNTLSNEFVSGISSPGLLESASRLAEAAQRLGYTVDAMLQKLGLQEGEPLAEEVFDLLTRSGLVVELILLPVSTLREVQELITSTNVI